MSPDPPDTDEPVPAVGTDDGAGTAAGPAPRTGRFWTPAVLVAAVTPLLVAAPQLMRIAVKPMDEGQLLSYPSLMLDGYRANSDFVYTYGINNLWLLTAAFRVAGPEVVVERAVGLVVRVALVLLVTDLVRRIAGRWAALVAGLTASLVLVSGGLMAFAWLSGLTVALAAAWLAANASLRRGWLDDALPWFLVGISIGFRLDLAPPAVLAVLVTRRLRTGRWCSLPAVLGLALGCAPLLVHALLADDVVRDTVISPVLNGGGRRLPLIPEARTLALLALALLGSAAVVVAAMWLLRADRHTRRYANLTGLGVPALLTLPQMFQRLDIEHLQQVAPVLIPAGIGAAAYLVEAATATTGAPRARRPVLAGCLALAGAVLALLVLPSLQPSLRATAKWYLGTPPATVTVTDDDRSVVVTERTATDLRPVLSELADLDAPECRRLFVGPADLRFARYSDTYLYFLLPRYEPASRYLEFNPGDANRTDSPLAEELRTADVVVLNDAFDDLDEPNSSSDPGPDEPNRVVRDRFRTVAEHGSWTVMATEECVAASRR